MQVQEEAVGRPVLVLMREATEVAVAERGAVWQQLRGAEEEAKALQAERAAEQQKATMEKAALQAKLSEAEAAVARLKVRDR